MIINLFHDLDPIDLTLVIRNRLRYQKHFVWELSPKQTDMAISMLNRFEALQKNTVEEIELTDLEARLLYDGLTFHIVNYPHEQEANEVSRLINKIRTELDIETTNIVM